MKIHLVYPTYGGNQGVMANELSIEEKFTNCLLSCAYRDNEKSQCNLWEGLIFLANNTQECKEFKLEENLESIE